MAEDKQEVEESTAVEEPVDDGKPRQSKPGPGPAPPLSDYQIT